MAGKIANTLLFCFYISSPTVYLLFLFAYMYVEGKACLLKMVSAENGCRYLVFAIQVQCSHQLILNKIKVLRGSVVYFHIHDFQLTRYVSFTASAVQT